MGSINHSDEHVFLFGFIDFFTCFFTNKAVLLSNERSGSACNYQITPIRLCKFKTENLQDFQVQVQIVVNSF